MKKTILLSLVALSSINAQEVSLENITVTSTVIKDVSGEEVKSADLAEALAYKVPSINLIRRSGIANDIVLRGQNRDNINVLVDGTKTYGACPNRMDPAISHVLTDNIADIEITEGPYDVENFGTLSGAVKIDTVKPEEGFHGNINAGFGSWDYRKGGISLTGGTKKVRGLISVSGETSDQYKDGDGKSLAQQVKDQVTGTNIAGTQYKNEYFNMDAYTKKTLMAKIYADITDDQELKLSYIANRSEDIMYPSSKMDALWDDSNLYNADYKIKNIGAFSKELSFQLFKSDVDHPMSTKYRNSSGTSSVNEVISHLKTDFTGAKVKNSFDIVENYELTVGLDGSQRLWDGSYSGYGMMRGISGRKSIDNAKTTNVAIFSELNQNLNKLNIKYGARYDSTRITSDRASQQDNNYQALSANAFATYGVSDSFEVFGGAGKSSRVPDARELYFVSSNGTTQTGTDNLEQTTNYEIDLGVKFESDNATLKIKTFYSMLKDYIYYKATNYGANVMGNNFVNLDATIYGGEISGEYYFNDEFYTDAGVAYQRGQKDSAISGQTNKNLANITPLKGTVALNYDYLKGSTARAEMVAADKWSNYDSDNGEQELAGYAILNLKVTHQFAKSFEMSVGLNNAFDQTYAISNTYKDLILLQSAGDEVMLINEPGRYAYINASYKF
ncbi:MAG: TonB-dependent receptor [Campylobacterota bacterium]|nr:TonB-dependent receptor [Campylobacterota bacterium]